MPDSILRTEIVREHDVVLARRRARQIAGLLGFNTAAAAAPSLP